MKTKQHGFTLIELLTVIAIIAILAAILLPVFGRAREQGRRTSCMSNLHQIALAMKMYKQDCRGYPLDWPETVAGHRPFYTGSRWYGNDSKTQPGYGIATLYPDYVPNLRVFNCPNNDETDPKFSNGVDGKDYAHWIGDGDKNNYRHFNSYDGTDPLFVISGDEELTAHGSAYKYRRRPWATDAYTGGSAVISRDQAKRMLIWRNPSEDTVITWCSQHRADPYSGTPRSGDLDLIVYLDGSTKTVKSNPGAGESGHGSNAAGAQ